MQLPSEFIQLPVLFVAEQLATEALQFSEGEWQDSTLAGKVNARLPLVATHGEAEGARLGELQPTAALLKCPYIQQVVASFKTVIGRVELIRVDPACEAARQLQIDPASRHRVSIHIPIITNPAVIFSSGLPASNVRVHMGAGEAWIIDEWRSISVTNNGQQARIHLIVETLGNADFWEFTKMGQNPRMPIPDWGRELLPSPYEVNRTTRFECERHIQQAVISADELAAMMHELLADLSAMRKEARPQYEQLAAIVEDLLLDWRSCWSLYADTAAGLPHFSLLLKEAGSRLQPLLTNRTLDSNGAAAGEVFDIWLGASLNQQAVPQPASAEQQSDAARSARRSPDLALFESPVFIVAAPRSGSTLLFESLKHNRELWTLSDESHQVFESINALHPASKNFASNVLSAEDYNEGLGDVLVGAFLRRLRSFDGTLFATIAPDQQASTLRFLEKTPKNALRIQFLRKLFPEALFIFLYRQARPNIGSIIDAWNSGKFVTYPKLPDWSGQPWSLLLPAGWREFDGRPLAEIAAWQWAATNQKILSDLQVLPAGTWYAVSHESFLDEPEATLKNICEFIDIPFGPRMQALAGQTLPYSKYTLSEPAVDKWKRHQADIESALSNIPEVADVIRLIGTLPASSGS